MIGDVEIEDVALDVSGGVWFQTRQVEAGFIFDYWYSGIVHAPGNGVDPFGNRGMLELQPLGDGWFGFRGVDRGSGRRRPGP